jgi:Protease inhibitor Inh
MVFTYLCERCRIVSGRTSLPPPAPPIGVPQVTPIDPDKAPPLPSLPGTYVVDRYTEREVCQIWLAPRILGSSARYEARLLEGCRDQGLRTFDPLAWRYEGGRLTLTSRRGHEVTLVSERPGHWRRDPEVGATLVLRKMAGP